MRDLTILLPTRHGMPADLLEAVTAAGVSIDAACLFPRDPGRIAHVAIHEDDVETVRGVVAAQGGAVLDVRECVVVPPGYAGGAPAMARRIADAGGSVNVAYYGAGGQLILATADLDAARAALGLD